MDRRLVGLLIASTVAFAACSSARSAAPVPPAAVLTSNVGNATGTLSIKIPARHTAASLRRPAYISPSTSNVTLFIDSVATGFRASCTVGTTCSIVWNSSAGPHVFAAEIDDSATISGGGTVLAEGSESVTLVAGPNTLAPITLNGVPAQIAFVGQTPFAAGTPTCNLLNATTNCVHVTYGIADADSNAIVLPGTFDDGGLALGANGTSGAAYSANQAAPDTAGNDYPAVLGCSQGATGTYTASPILVNPSATPELSAAQLATYTLTYPNQSSLLMQHWPAYICSNGVLSYLGATGNIYAANANSNAVTEYVATATGNIAPVATVSGMLTGLNDPGPVAADASGNIYVANDGASQPYSVVVFPAPTTPATLNESPTATIVGSNTGLSAPVGIALDASGNIYVLNNIKTITVYAAKPAGTLNETPIATVNGTGLASVSAIAVDESGKIYVADSGLNAIDVFAANPSGNVNESPIAVITGAATGLAQPYAIAFDSAGNIYVANIDVYGGNDSVTVYPANPSGTLNESPLATIAGSNTGLHQPLGLAVGPTGEIYVGNHLGNSITAYPANPSGTVNEAPIATIQGSSTQLNSPYGIAIH